MSAIFGIFYRDGRPVDPADIERMQAILAHRGPDGTDRWVRGPVGLGHRMLRTTPESLYEHQPLVSRDEALVLTADARIDNRAELIDTLNLRDRPADLVTDADLILAAYERWGERCPEHLLGDFAFAVWDERRQQLFCARDHFGVRPLYYYCCDKVLVFASEIKALLLLEEIPASLNELQVGDFLAGVFDDKEATFYRDIFRLPPAYCLMVKREGRDTSCYWKPDPTNELRLASDNDYAEAFRAHFEEAVTCRLRSQHEIGSMLSGGLDSSAVTCVASSVLAQTGRKPLKTYSAIFDNVRESDEREYINAVIAQASVEPYFMRGDCLNPLANLEKIYWISDEPLGAYNLYINRGIYDLAKGHNVRVILDGFDGDTTVSHGTGYFNELATNNQWIQLAVELRAYTMRLGGDYWGMLRELMWCYYFNPLTNKNILFRQLYRRWRALIKRLPIIDKHRTRTTGLRSIISEEFIVSFNMREHWRRLRQERSGLIASEREQHCRILSWGVMSHTLEVLNKTSNAESIELRYPFWDKRLVEFCLSLPAQQKLRNGWSRLVMRNALHQYVPAKVLWRPGKSNLGHSFNYSLRVYGLDDIRNVVEQKIELIQQYVQVSALKDAHHQFIGASNSDINTMVLFKTVSLALWLQSTKLAL